MDPLLIKFASFMSRSNPTREFYFVNIIKSLKIPKEVQQEFPELVDNAYHDRVKNINEIVEANLDFHPESTSEVIVKQGNPYKEILKLINELKIDLIVMGRRPISEGTAVILNQVVRRANCNILIVPKGCDNILEDQRPVRKIIVANDFSHHSKLALEHAINLATNSHTTKEIEVYCQHVYTVPMGYHYTGKSFDEFAEVMRNNAEKSYAKFIRKVDTKGVKVSPVFTLDQNDSLEAAIHGLANEIRADGIIFGARGVTSGTAVFIGSSAEKMLKIESPIPLFVVRNRGESVGLLEYIRKF